MSTQNFSVFAPTGANNSSFLIDEVFYREIALHIYKNRVKNINAPLILSIQGQKGEGKTSHIINVCRKLGVFIIYIHGSAISGQHEGEPAEIIKAGYFEASNYQKIGKNSVILIDDIDTSVASTNDDRRYTVNSQIVNGTLMSIADNPTVVGGQSTYKVPMIFTGNDLTNLYPPLRRNGRMKIFSWEPSKTTKISIIKFIFKEVVSVEDKYRFENLILRYIDQPISFFIELKSDLYDDYLWEIINKNNVIDFSQIDGQLFEVLHSPIYFEAIKIKISHLAKIKVKNYN